MDSALERRSPEGIKLHRMHSSGSLTDLWLEVVGIYVKKRARLRQRLIEVDSITVLSPVSRDATTWTLQHRHGQRVTATKAAGSYSFPTEAGGEDLRQCEYQERRLKVEFNVKQQSCPLYNSRKLMRGSECLIEVDVEKQKSQSPGGLLRSHRHGDRAFCCTTLQTWNCYGFE